MKCEFFYFIKKKKEKKIMYMLKKTNLRIVTCTSKHVRPSRAARTALIHFDAGRFSETLFSWNNLDLFWKYIIVLWKWFGVGEH